AAILGPGGRENRPFCILFREPIPVAPKCGKSHPRNVRPCLTATQGSQCIARAATGSGEYACTPTTRRQSWRRRVALTGGLRHSGGRARKELVSRRSDETNSSFISRRRQRVEKEIEIVGRRDAVRVNEKCGEPSALSRRLPRQLDLRDRQSVGQRDVAIAQGIRRWRRSGKPPR